MAEMRTFIGAGIAFGITLFLGAIGIAILSYLGLGGSIVDSLANIVIQFLNNFGGVLTIAILVAVVLGSLGLSKIIERTVGGGGGGV